VSKAIKQILVPTDLSDLSKSAAQWAAMLQHKLSAKVTVMHASEVYIPYFDLGAYAAHQLQTDPEMRQRITDELRKFVVSQFTHSEAVDSIIVDEEPARAIVETASKIGADLVVMATHARKGWQRTLLGSVAEKVLHESKTAVMTVRPYEKAPSPQIRRILCPVNFTPIGRITLEQSGALAQALGAELLIVHIADHWDEPHLDKLKADMAKWIDEVCKQPFQYSQFVAHGDAPEGVLRIAEEAKTDLIVIGAQHKRFSDATVIGSTTERVVRFAKCPVLTVVAGPEKKKQ
jgi:nucleotide-binding universal stress UspA family protein